MKCQLCQNSGELSAVVKGKYHTSLCRPCLAGLLGDVTVSSGAQGFDRRRQYEEHAQDVVQPWDAAGKANVEFLRLYPHSAAKQYSPEILEELKKRL